MRILGRLLTERYAYGHVQRLLNAVIQFATEINGLLQYGMVSAHQFTNGREISIYHQMISSRWEHSRG